MVHITLRENLPGIARAGLDPAISTGKQALVWLMRPSAIRRFFGHITRRHNSRPLSDYAVLVVRVRRCMLVKTSWRGVWACRRVIVPSRISYAGTLDDKALAGIVRGYKRS